MSARRWLRTQRALIAEVDAHLATIAEQRTTIADLDRRLEESRSLTAQARRLAEQRADQLGSIRIQAMRLREQIRRLETGDGIDPELRYFIAADSRVERGED